MTELQCSAFSTLSLEIDSNALFEGSQPATSGPPSSEQSTDPIAASMARSHHVPLRGPFFRRRLGHV